MTVTPVEHIFSSRYLWITIGSCALVFLGAFESLAVTTIMPIVSADLDGASLYALAFSGPLAVGVIGMVVAGNWSDRSGPVTPLYCSAAIFMVGLLIAGTAETMGVFVAGRLVQGLGSGAISVALYVIVARIYPETLRARIFAGFAASWVIPSLIGPFAAAVVTQLTSWHWVFLGVIGLVLVASAMVFPATRLIRTGQSVGSVVNWSYRRIGWSVLAAVAVLAVSIIPDVAGVRFGVVFAIGVPCAVIAVAVLAVRPLTPSGTLIARRGLPTVIALRGLVSAAFLGAEVYLPYLLIERYSLTPAIAGLALTGGAIAWAASSWLQGHLGDRLTHLAAVRYGTSLVLASVLVVFLTVLLGLSAVVPIVAWVIGGGGMGLIYPRLSVMTLGLSRARDQGFNSSALIISDSLGAALSLAATAVIFGILSGAGARTAFAGCFALATVCALLGVLVAGRIVQRGTFSERGSVRAPLRRGR